MPYRNKTYVAFDGDSDIHYYRLLQAWRQTDGSSFPFYDAHSLNWSADTSKNESIKAQLRIRFQSSSLFVLLVGEKTRFLRKFVPWEIEQARTRGLPIICCNLAGLRNMDTLRCPNVFQTQTALHISFNKRILQHAMEHWAPFLSSDRIGPDRGPFHYGSEIYAQLGIG